MVDLQGKCSLWELRTIFEGIMHDLGYAKSEADGKGLEGVEIVEYNIQIKPGEVNQAFPARIGGYNYLQVKPQSEGKDQDQGKR